MNKYLIAFFLLFQFSGVLSQSEVDEDESVKLVLWVEKAKENVFFNSNSENECKDKLIKCFEIGYQEGVIVSYKCLINKVKHKEFSAKKLQLLLSFENYCRIQGIQNEQKLVLEQIGDLFGEFKLNEKSISAYKKALEIDVDQKSDLRIKNKLGLLFFNEGIHDKALIVFSKIDSINSLSKNWQAVIEAKGRMAKIYKAKKKHLKSLELYQSSLELADSFNLASQRINSINNIGYTYQVLKKHQESIRFFQRLLTEKETVMNAIAYQNIGVVYQNKNDIELALVNFTKALELYEKYDKKLKQAKVLKLISHLYFQKSDYHNAIIFANDCKKNAKLQSFGDLYTAVNLLLSKIYDRLYDYENALHFNVRYLHIRDSMDQIRKSFVQELELQQLFLNQTESQMNKHFINEEIKDLEIQNLNAQKKIDREKLARFQSDIMRMAFDSLLNKEKIKNQFLKLSEIENLLAMEKQESKISKLDQEKSKHVSDLKIEKLENKRKEKNLILEKRNNEILGFELREKESFTRNLYYLLGGLAVLSIVFIAFFFDISRRKRKIEKQQQIIEREKEKSESLLLNILPAAIADELKETGKTTPKFIENASVVFTDFSGFTQISEILSPVELVEKLDEIFLEFDLISERNGLSRIKTIGDAYMCAGGILDENTKHAESAVRSAIEMRDYIDAFNEKIPFGSPSWNIRIGVNTGPIVAGVVGTKKFAYDIWGDAVNIASRMESSGEIGKINISSSTFELTKDVFSLQFRGKIAAKNKGNIDMYFAESYNAQN